MQEVSYATIASIIVAHFPHMTVDAATRTWTYNLEQYTLEQNAPELDEQPSVYDPTDPPPTDPPENLPDEVRTGEDEQAYQEG